MSKFILASIFLTRHGFSPQLGISLALHSSSRLLAALPLAAAQVFIGRQSSDAAELKDRVEDLTRTAERIFLEQLCPESAGVGIIFSSNAELNEEDVKALDEVFEERIFPVLTPLAVDPSHPFPYISHLSLNLAVLVRDTRFVEVVAEQAVT